MKNYFDTFARDEIEQITNNKFNDYNIIKFYLCKGLRMDRTNFILNYFVKNYVNMNLEHKKFKILSCYLKNDNFKNLDYFQKIIECYQDDQNVIKNNSYNLNTIDVDIDYEKRSFELQFDKFNIFHISNCSTSKKDLIYFFFHHHIRIENEFFEKDKIYVIINLCYDNDVKENFFKSCKRLLFLKTFVTTYENFFWINFQTYLDFSKELQCFYSNYNTIIYDKSSEEIKYESTLLKIESYNKDFVVYINNNEEPFFLSRVCFIDKNLIKRRKNNSHNQEFDVEVEPFLITIDSFFFKIIFYVEIYKFLPEGKQQDICIEITKTSHYKYSFKELNSDSDKILEFQPKKFIMDVKDNIIIIYEKINKFFEESLKIYFK
ncbi:hypothetical protein GVAV_001787 [Gurleya vavrai]